jgi:biopolymer transport protein ExbD
MRFRRPPEEEPRLGLAPLIDIVFLLLIFFMLTSHFNLVAGIPVNLPKISHSGDKPEGSAVTLWMQDSGLIYLGEQKLTLGEIGPALQEIVKAKGPVSLILKADEKVRHGNVVQAMDLARRAGISSMTIAARWQREKAL